MISFMNCTANANFPSSLSVDLLKMQSQQETANIFSFTSLYLLISLYVPYNILKYLISYEVPKITWQGISPIV